MVKDLTKGGYTGSDKDNCTSGEKTKPIDLRGKLDGLKEASVFEIQNEDGSKVEYKIEFRNETKKYNWKLEKEIEFIPYNLAE